MKWTAYQLQSSRPAFSGRIFTLLPCAKAAGSNTGLGSPANPQPGRLALRSAGVHACGFWQRPAAIFGSSGKIHPFFQRAIQAVLINTAFQRGAKGRERGQTVSNGVSRWHPLKRLP
jgi:hypothetical protein